MASLLSRQQPVHFIGIGGIGMSALALILAKRGQRVSGSEPKSSPIVKQLSDLGVEVFPEQTASTITTLTTGEAAAPQVVVSSAILSTTPN